MARYGSSRQTGVCSSLTTNDGGCRFREHGLESRATREAVDGGQERYDYDGCTVHCGKMFALHIKESAWYACISSIEAANVDKYNRAELVMISNNGPHQL